MTRLEHQIQDFIHGGMRLFWQRQAMFFGAGALSAYYVHPVPAGLGLFLCLLSEMLDLAICRYITRKGRVERDMSRRNLALLILSSTVSASAVAAFAILIARTEGVGVHFTPLFFLFTAALFAAMNNHQLLRVLMIRLVIYGIAFIYIPLNDLIAVKPPLSSPLWLQFITILFVLYFVIDCSIVFLRIYRAGLDRHYELQREHDRTKMAYETKTQFLAMVNHELRTPLTSIKGSLDMINRGVAGEVPPAMKELLTVASRNSERLGNLINDLLDLQKIEAGEMKLKIEDVELTQILNETITGIDSFARMMNVRVHFVQTGAKYYTESDASRLVQVFTNVISNAVKFSNAHSTVNVTIERMGSQVRVAVQDFGCGIPDGSKEKVFDQFSQIDSSDKRKFGGTGLGMNISRRILTALGGEIDYTSVEGRGTTFFIDLPLKTALPSPQVERVAKQGSAAVFAPKASTAGPSTK